LEDEAEMDKKEVRVFGVTYSPTGTVVLILEETAGERILPVWIGEFEGQSIDMALRGIQPQRPFPYDLIISSVTRMGGSIQEIIVSSLHENTFFATVKIVRDGESILIDSRTSDAVAIALRAKSPIFVSEEVLAEAGYPRKFLKQVFESEKGEGAEGKPEEIPADEAEKFKDFIAKVKPEDFKKPGAP
jgi:bifunctional DNase/RNase